jgi:hypothetical protein
MSKYNLLSDRLTAHPAEEWRTSFSEIETVLGFALPKAARTGRAWWANDPDRSHSRAWTAHGWEVGDVDHAAERVVFRRGAASGLALVQAAGLQPLHGEGEPEAPAEPTPVAADDTQAPPEPAPQPQPTAQKRSAVSLPVMVAAAVAVAAGLGAMLVRRLRRR